MQNLQPDSNRLLRVCTVLQGGRWAVCEGNRGARLGGEGQNSAEFPLKTRFQIIFASCGRPMAIQYPPARVWWDDAGGLQNDRLYRAETMGTGWGWKRSKRRWRRRLMWSRSTTPTPTKSIFKSKGRTTCSSPPPWTTSCSSCLQPFCWCSSSTGSSTACLTTKWASLWGLTLSVGPSWDTSAGQHRILHLPDSKKLPNSLQLQHRV